MSIWFEIIAILFMIAFLFLQLMNYNATRNNFEALKKIYDLSNKVYQMFLIDGFFKAGKTFLELVKKRFKKEEGKE